MTNSKFRPFSSREPRQQRGATLVTSLLLLLVLTVIGVSAMQMSRLQERMAGNARDVGVSFQAAESALKDAEAKLLAAATTTGQPSLCSALGGCATVYEPLLVPALGNQTQAWWDANAREYGTNAGALELEGVTREPQFVVEEIANVDGDPMVDSGSEEVSVTLYRITARSTGATDATSTVLQSTYAYPF
jgi:type IV pilus assembly protein PilX